MNVKILIYGNSSKSLVIEPWGEEFDIDSKDVEIVFNSIEFNADCRVEMDYSEDGFLRIENPLGFRPTVLIDGMEDERPAFLLS